MRVDARSGTASVGGRRYDLVDMPTDVLVGMVLGVSPVRAAALAQTLPDPLLELDLSRLRPERVWWLEPAPPAKRKLPGITSGKTSALLMEVLRWVEGS